MNLLTLGTSSKWLQTIFVILCLVSSDISSSDRPTGFVITLHIILCQCLGFSCVGYPSSLDQERPEGSSSIAQRGLALGSSRFSKFLNSPGTEGVNQPVGETLEVRVQ